MASLGISRGPRAAGASQGVRGLQSEGLGAGRVRGPEWGGQQGARECAVSRLWVCAPSSLRVTFTPVLFFKMEGSLGLALNCSPRTPGRICDPVLFGKTHAALFSLYV